MLNCKPESVESFVRRKLKVGELHEVLTWFNWMLQQPWIPLEGKQELTRFFCAELDERGLMHKAEEVGREASDLLQEQVEVNCSCFWLMPVRL
jgi:hypothetical protein